MPNNKAYSSATLVKSYVKPRYYRLVNGYASLNEVSKSRVVNQALKKFFDEMSEEDRQRMMREVREAREE